MNKIDQSKISPQYNNVKMSRDKTVINKKFYGAKKDPQYLIGYFGKAIRQLVLILPKTSGYVKTFKDKSNSKKNKLIYFCIDDNKLLEKYKNTRTKIENHEILN